MTPLGKQLSPILEELENALWEHEQTLATPPEYTDEGFRAICKLFMSGIMDKMWVIQEKEGMSMEDRGNMAKQAGEKVRSLVKTYTGIDTYDLYKS